MDNRTNKHVWQKPSAKVDPKLIAMFGATHLLIGGETKSGKSTLMNALMMNALAKYSPSEVQFILIDTKKVELSQYKDLPHTIRFVKYAKDVPAALDYVCQYMEEEYARMESVGIRETNKGHLYVIIDEIADLMLSPFSKDIKRKLQTILQIGRACHVHCIAATQSPSRKTLPAEIVINFTDRVALHCASAIESRQILNQKGAETLSEVGTCLYKAPMKNLKILSNIPFFTDAQIRERVAFWVAQKPKEEESCVPYVKEILKGIGTLAACVGIIGVELGVIMAKATFWFVGSMFGFYGRK